MKPHEVDVRNILGFLRLPRGYVDVDSLHGETIRLSTCSKCGSTIILTFAIPKLLTEAELSLVADRTIIFDIYGKVQDLSEFYGCSPCRTNRNIYPVLGTVGKNQYIFIDGMTESVVLRRDPQAASRYNLPFPKLEDLN